MLENATYKNLFLIIQESISIIKKGGEVIVLFHKLELRI